MKNVILTLFAATMFFTAKAQIFTENTYSSSSFGPLHLVRLTVNGDKYCQYFSSTIVLYNLNHTVYRTINFPTLPAGSNIMQIYFVSDALFDQNPADIEFVVQYVTPANGNFFNIGIYRENGTLLFNRDSTQLYSSPSPDINRWIFETAVGTKMLLNHHNGAVSIVALPGSLPCRECGNVGPTMIQSNENASSTGSPYPNPAADFTTIPYALPEGERTGWLVLFDVAGQEVKRFQITSTFTSVTLSTADIASGTYSYGIETGQTVLPGEKLIIIH